MSDHGLPTTRNKVQELQRTLYRAAKADPRRRFHALYDKVYRRDILERAWEIQFLARWPSRRAMQRARDRIRELTARSRLLLSPTRVVAEVNRFLRGWASYFCYGNSAQALHALHWYAGQRLTIWWGKRQGWRRRHLTNPVPLANHLGLLSLGGHVVAPRPDRPWQGVPHASR